MNAAQCGVKSHLSDWDAHASRTLIAESQDSLTIADHDAFHVVVAGMIENLLDTVLVRIAEKETSRLSPYFAEALAAFTHRWRIDQGKHLLYIAHQQRIEEGFIHILQVSEKAVLRKGGWLSPQGLQPALNLFIETAHVWWQ